MRQLKSISELELGDTIRHINDGEFKQVIYLGDEYVLAISTTHVSNPSKWLVADKAQAKAQAPKEAPISFELRSAIENLIDAKIHSPNELKRQRNILEETIKLALGSSDHVS